MEEGEKIRPLPAPPDPLLLFPLARSAGASRRYVARRLAELDATAVEDAAELGVSELVTNAILHGRTRLAVTVERTPAGRVRVEVSDGSPVLPQQRRTSATATTGRGLGIVAALSSDWGVEALPGAAGKCVWFEPVETFGDVAAVTASASTPAPSVSP